MSENVSKLKPKDLKEPTKCCGAKVLLWDRSKRYYSCPCGVVKINETGRPVGKVNLFVSKASFEKKNER